MCFTADTLLTQLINTNTANAGAMKGTLELYGQPTLSELIRTVARPLVPK